MKPPRLGMACDQLVAGPGPIIFGCNGPGMKHGGRHRDATLLLLPYISTLGMGGSNGLIFDPALNHKYFHKYFEGRGA